MNRRTNVLAPVGALLAVALAFGAVADETDLGPVTSLKVDLGEVVELGTVSPVDGITAAGQPDEAALEVFADAGYATVIDLRGSDEERGFDEAAVVDELGLHYVTLPIVGKDAISFDNARKLDGLLEQYPGPVLVHCGSSNRVGALLALRASLDGADDETALAAGREGGLTSLEGVVRERLDQKDE
ncbi:MAG TPA: sulfur transferase domain-containing protein [Woeseiaceae bacterium]|nr:sulfur transferase domain-containing protein [Woeseiaceae bacterium]